MKRTRLEKRKVILFLMIAATAMLLMAVINTAAQAPTALTAAHRNGQTFIVWNEASAAGTTYNIYRSATPITTPAQLTAANRIGTAGERSSFNERLSAILSDATTYYVIQNGAPALTETNGLFVVTPSAAGSSFYAVTSISGGVENQTLVIGQNSLASAVAESTAPVQPVFQRTFVRINRTFESYVHWTSNVARSDYPAMSNRSSVPYNFGLQRRGSTPTHSLLISLHARGGNFVNPNSTNDGEQWILSLDDYLPNSLNNTFWYGYHENFDLSTGAGFPTSGTVPDYTVRRAKWTIEWALSTLPIDRERVYMMGGSMGGIGSFFLSLKMADKIAAIHMVIPKFDFSFTNDPNPGNIWNLGTAERQVGDALWSATDVNLASSDGIPIYDRLNGGDMVRMLKTVDLPIMFAFNGKSDTVVGWAEKLGFYAAMNESRHHGAFYFDSRPHGSGGTREWTPIQNPNIINRFRLSMSYPAFSNSSANGNPGTGLATSGDTFGTISGNLDWDETNIVDTADRYEIVVKTIALNSTLGLIAAPSQAAADVTIRRRQSFRPAIGEVLRFENRDVNNQLVASGTVSVDESGLLTIPQFAMTPSGNRLIVTRVQPQAPTLLSATFSRGGSIVSRPLVGDAMKRYSVTLFGTNFDAATKVVVNGTEMPTTFVSAGEIIARLAPGNVPAVGRLSVRARNGTGAESQSLSF